MEIGDALRSPYMTFLRLFLVLMVASSVGCTLVKPYQREYLAKPVMSLAEAPEAALLEQHVFEYREGSAGGYGGGGGGCGCN